MELKETKKIAESAIHINNLNEPEPCYILVHSKDNEYANLRSVYENNLKNTGLQVTLFEEYEDKCFIKVVAPKDVLLKFCEVMKLRMPVKTDLFIRKKKEQQLFHTIVSYIWCIFFCKFEETTDTMTEQFSRDKMYLFDINSEKFMPACVKHMVVNFILEKEAFVDEDTDDFGITKLLIKGAYEAAYPLHDENVLSSLSQEWSIIGKRITDESIDKMKNYFGVKIALYFTWLKFYNRMLIPASIIGILTMIYGLVTIPSDSTSREICHATKDIIMCPQCDQHCDYWNLKEACNYSVVSHLFDNSFTVAFAIIMSMWSALYLNLWKRFSAATIYEWGLTNDITIHEDLPSEIYYLKKNSRNAKKWKKWPRLFFSFTVVLFWISLVFAILFAVIFYKMSLIASEELFGNDSKISMFVTVMGSVFDIIIILVLNYVFDLVSLWLTKHEYHRTQTQFEDSYMWKLYVFYFINFYSSLFYIAFIKGRFLGRPGAYRRIFGHRQEECGTGGCIVELFIQLAAVMIGDITYNNIIEYYVTPYCQKKNKCKYCTGQEYDPEINTERKSFITVKQCIHDFELLEWKNTDIAKEYLEMVIQYGFVTLFVAAFPLAPLLALINNKLEVRMDANKLLKKYRRPVDQIVKNIGIWTSVMNLIYKVSILSNACIIAFRTNFIPLLVYKVLMNKNVTNEGSLNFTLSYFATKDFEQISIPLKSKHDHVVDVCRYQDFRNPPEHENKYEVSNLYWYIVAARLIFVLIYQNVVVVLKLIIKWMIPETPHAVKSRINNDAKEIQNYILQYERRKLENRNIRHTCM